MAFTGDLHFQMAFNARLELQDKARFIVVKLVGQLRKLQSGPALHVVQTLICQDRLRALKLRRQAQASLPSLGATHFKNVREVRVETERHSNLKFLRPVVQEANGLIAAGSSKRRLAKRVDDAP